MPLPQHRRSASAPAPRGATIAELTDYARSLIDQVTDDVSPEEAARIEREHSAVVARISAMRQAERRGIANRMGFGDEAVAKYADLSDADFKGRIWDDSVVRDEREQPRTFGHLPIEATFDNPDFRGHAIAEALHSRMTGAAPSGPAREFAGLTLLEVGRHVLESAGVRTRSMSRTALADAMLGTRSGWGASPGLHTTSDFSNLLLSAGQRTLADAYQAARSPLLQLARPRQASDFRTLNVLRLSEMPELLPVAEGAEVRYGSRSESKEAFKLTTFARIFALSREALINDDLDSFGRINQEWGQAAAQVEANQVWALFSDNGLAGVALDDSTAWFHVSRGNLAGTPSTIDVSNLSLARQALRTTTGLDGSTVLALSPAFLVVGAQMETLAEKLLADIAAAQVSEVNPFSGKLTLLVEPRIPDKSWYVFSAPQQATTIEVAYLGDAQGPQLSQRDGWNTLGSEFRAVFDFGAGVTGWRGSFRNPGA